MLAHVGALSTRAQVGADKSDTCGAQPPPTSWPLGWSTPSRRQIQTELVSLPLFPSIANEVALLGRIVRAESGEMCELLHTSRVVQKMMGSRRVIPNPIDQNPWAHWRSPMDMMRQG